MPTEIIVALLALFGTLIGTLAGILTSSSLTSHRLTVLEKKMDEYNTLSVRVSVLEKDNSSQWTKINEMHDDIKTIRKEVTKS